MNKEMLIELKKNIENKYMVFDGIDDGKVISLYEIKTYEDTEGFVENLENYFEALIKYLSVSNIDYDELNIPLYFNLFYKENEYEELNNKGYIPQKNAQPLKDYMIISTGVFLAKNGITDFDDDPECIYKDCYKSYIVSFEKVKEILETRGFELKNIKTLEEIQQKFNNRNYAIANISIKFNRPKIKKLELGE